MGCLSCDLLLHCCAYTSEKKSKDISVWWVMMEMIPLLVITTLTKDTDDHSEDCEYMNASRDDNDFSGKDI